MSKRVVDFILAEQIDVNSTLQQSVINGLNQGWCLYGQPLLNSKNIMVQPMVKYEETNLDKMLAEQREAIKKLSIADIENKRLIHHNQSYAMELIKEHEENSKSLQIEYTTELSNMRTAYRKKIGILKGKVTRLTNKLRSK